MPASRFAKRGGQLEAWALSARGPNSSKSEFSKRFSWQDKNPLPPPFHTRFSGTLSLPQLLRTAMVTSL